MIRAWTVDDVRAAEGELLSRTPPGALMQRAAAGLAAAAAGELRRCRGRVSGAGVVLLVGAGNNGGDALWAGERLARRGASVTVVTTTDHPHAEGLAAVRAAGGRLLHGGQDGDPARRALAGADLVLDGVVGLGGHPGLREPAAGLVPAIGQDAVVVAVDLPSGVDPDTGQTPAEHVRADLTVTFGAAKPCLLLPPASVAAGRLRVVDIGLLPSLERVRERVQRYETADLAAAWPVPGPAMDKYRRGVLGVVAGSDAYPGAAVLACGGALRAGVGMLRYLGPDNATDTVRRAWPEVVAGSGRVQAYLLGSGVDASAGDGQRAHIEAALAGPEPCLVDAGALELLAEPRSAGTLATPHAGELARWLSRLEGGQVSRDDVEARPYEHARRAAAASGATVLLKGATTLVVAPDGEARSQADAAPWLATAGAGDVLAGVAGALLAAGLTPLEAGAVAAAVHGRASDQGRPLTSLDVADAVPGVVAGLLAAEAD